MNIGTYQYFTIVTGDRKHSLKVANGKVKMYYDSDFRKKGIELCTESIIKFTKKFIMMNNKPECNDIIYSEVCKLFLSCISINISKTLNEVFRLIYNNIAADSSNKIDKKGDDINNTICKNLLMTFINMGYNWLGHRIHDKRKPLISYPGVKGIAISCIDVLNNIYSNYQYIDMSSIYYYYDGKNYNRLVEKAREKYNKTIYCIPSLKIMTLRTIRIHNKRVNNRRITSTLNITRKHDTINNTKLESYYNVSRNSSGPLKKIDIEKIPYLLYQMNLFPMNYEEKSKYYHK